MNLELPNLKLFAGTSLAIAINAGCGTTHTIGVNPDGTGGHYAGATGGLGDGDQRGGELLVEGEEVFHAVPVAGERLGPVTAVHRTVQLLMRLEQRRGHRQRVIQIGQR